MTEQRKNELCLWALAGYLLWVAGCAHAPRRDSPTSRPVLGEAAGAAGDLLLTASCAAGAGE